MHVQQRPAPIQPYFLKRYSMIVDPVSPVHRYFFYDFNIILMVATLFESFFFFFCWGGEGGNGTS